MQISHKAIFPKIIGHTIMPSFEFIQDPIIDWIYDYQRNNEGVVKSNNGGWQSKSKFYEEESFSPFLDCLDGVISSYMNFTYDDIDPPRILNAWININHPNSFNLLHNHPVSDLSGCFYIKVPEDSGVIVFHNPDDYNSAKCFHSMNKELKNQSGFDVNYGIFPAEGSVFFFPSFLQHEVTKNDSKYDRISIAFNLTFRSNSPMTQ